MAKKRLFILDDKSQKGPYVPQDNGRLSHVNTSKQPPVRDVHNRPLRWSEKLQDWVIDTARWIDEINSQE